MDDNSFEYEDVLSRKIVFKVLLILAILLLLILLIPMFISYKPSNKNIKTDLSVNTESNDKMSENLTKMKEASYSYFTEDKLPKNSNETKKVNLRTLYKKTKISTVKDANNKKCDAVKSYTTITMIGDDYLVKVYLKCSTDKDYILVHAGRYENCNNTICEKKIDDDNNNYKDIDDLYDDKTDKDKDKDKDKEEKDDKEESVVKEFGNWSDYTRGDCNTREISCDINDTNCNREVRVYRKTEFVGRESTPYNTTPLVLNKIGTISRNVCIGYNYFMIQNSLYRTNGSYEEILKLNRRTTDSWEYQGTITTKSVPNFGGYTYFKYVKTDFSSCGTTCGEGEISYIYDVYRYKKNISKVTGKENCKTNTKVINNYNVVKNNIIVKRTEDKYDTVCYISERTRSE